MSDNITRAVGLLRAELAELETRVDLGRPLDDGVSRRIDALFAALEVLEPLAVTRCAGETE